MLLRLKKKQLHPSKQIRSRFEDLCGREVKQLEVTELKLMKEKVTVLSSDKSGTDCCQRQDTRQVNPKLHDMAHY